MRSTDRQPAVNRLEGVNANPSDEFVLDNGDIEVDDIESLLNTSSSAVTKMHKIDEIDVDPRILLMSADSVVASSDSVVQAPSETTIVHVNDRNSFYVNLLLTRAPSRMN